MRPERLESVLLLSVKCFELVELVVNKPLEMEHFQQRKLQLLPPPYHVRPFAPAAYSALAGEELACGIHEPGERGPAAREFRATVGIDVGKEQAVRANYDVGLGELVGGHLRQGHDVAHGEKFDRATGRGPSLHKAFAKRPTVPQEFCNLVDPLFEKVRGYDHERALRWDERALVYLGNRRRHRVPCRIDERDGGRCLAVAYLVREDAAAKLIGRAHPEVDHERRAFHCLRPGVVGSLELVSLALPFGVCGEFDRQDVTTLQDDSDHAGPHAAPTEGGVAHMGGDADSATALHAAGVDEVQVLRGALQPLASGTCVEFHQGGIRHAAHAEDDPCARRQV
mmetsp:Transcript_45979/g.133869  ORF Transcript_45979/g.133869 Transcript_45979/m.133869 type:complete len:339 (-) Transcript_45979:986-2002(-)